MTSVVVEKVADGLVVRDAPEMAWFALECLAGLVRQEHVELRGDRISIGGAVEYQVEAWEGTALRGRRVTPWPD